MALSPNARRMLRPETFAIAKSRTNSKSREVVNSISNGCASFVPESQILPPPLAIGGCIQINASQDCVLLNEFGHLLHHWTFIAPDIRHEQKGRGQMFAPPLAFPASFLIGAEFQAFYNSECWQWSLLGVHTVDSRQ